MKTPCMLLAIAICCLVVFSGCDRPARIEQTDHDRIIAARGIEPAMPVSPGPGEKIPDTDIIVAPGTVQRRDLPRDDEHALVCTAKLDLLRVFISSDETVQSSNGSYKTDDCKQKVTEHFSDMGYRVVEGQLPGYNASNDALLEIATSQNIDLFVLLWAQARPRDKFGNYYLFEADARGRVAQAVGSELVTTTSVYMRGKDNLREQKAAQSALEACGEQMGNELSLAILKKSGSGILTRRLVIGGLETPRKADYVRVGLLQKGGIHSVTLSRWDGIGNRAVFLVRLSASAMENLPAYLENIADVQLKVRKYEKTEVTAREKKFWEIR